MIDRPSRRRSLYLVARSVVVTVAVMTATGCATGASRDTAEGGDTAEGSVLVLAAASLTDVMADVESEFEAANPTYELEISLGGSASLRTQILEGAPADVVATANPTIMDDLVAAGRVDGQPETLATNRLVIALAPGNPAGVDDLADLADPSLFIGLCAAEVPCGELADRASAAAGIVIDADTREPDVRTLLTKIEAGELDAGLVYATDVATSTAGVTAIELPAGLPATTSYPIAIVTDSPEPDGGSALIAFLTGTDGQRILADHGFVTP